MLSYKKSCLAFSKAGMELKKDYEKKNKLDGERQLPDDFTIKWHIKKNKVKKKTMSNKNKTLYSDQGIKVMEFGMKGGNLKRPN